MKHLLSLFLRGALVPALFLQAPAYAAASEYTPDDLYRYRYVRLANGLDLFLKPRQGAHNVSIRMVAHVGTYDFPCGRKETPHFLEHLLFTGTSRHSESELDALIENNGGRWNATTSGEKTVYEVDIHDRYTSLALATLYEILTDSRFTQENVDRSRDIIHRESGGEPSALRNWFYRQGIGRSAQDKVDDLLWPAYLNCQELETASSIVRQDVVDAWEKYYVPNNMALVVVGNFNADHVLRELQASFGRLKPGVLPGQTSGKAPTPTRQRVTGTFSPVLDTEAYVSLHYQSLGYESAQVYPIILLNELMTEEVFRELRIERGLAYAPSSSIGFDRQVGVISLSADTELSRVDEVEQALLGIVERLRKQPVPMEELDRVRRRVLLTYAQGYEDNNSIASHYASLWRRFERDGKFVDLEQQLATITPRQFNALVKSVLDPDRVVIAISRPTLSYYRLYILLSFTVVLLVAVAAYYWWRRRFGSSGT